MEARTEMMERVLAQAADDVIERVSQSVVLIGQRHGFGAGLVWSPGLVVTNDHVAHGPEVMIEDRDGKCSLGTVKARDEQNDLALIAADARRPPVEVADWRDLRLGNVVFAFGHPMGWRDHAAFGIVSGLRESTWMGRSDRPLIQADLALAPGNSGGPVFDAQGRVVGIASMIASPGIALVVPSYVVARFVASQWKSKEA